MSSRIGLSAPATCFHATDNLFVLVNSVCQSQTVDAIFVDEAQFLEHSQVKQLSDVADELDIPARYGLRTDFQGKLFTGSEQLLAWADDLMRLRQSATAAGKRLWSCELTRMETSLSKAQIKIGGNDDYISVCRKHFKLGMISQKMMN